jgi:hypothetical protein
MARKQPAAAQMSDHNGIAFIDHDVFTTAAKDGGYSLREHSRNTNLARNFLPAPLTPLAGALEQAQPDTAYRYMRHGIATALKIFSPFTRDEGQEMARTPFCEDLHAPTSPSSRKVPRTQQTTRLLAGARATAPS